MNATREHGSKPSGAWNNSQFTDLSIALDEGSAQGLTLGLLLAEREAQHLALVALALVLHLQRPSTISSRIRACPAPHPRTLAAAAGSQDLDKGSAAAGSIRQLAIGLGLPCRSTGRGCAAAALGDECLV